MTDEPKQVEVPGTVLDKAPTSVPEAALANEPVKIELAGLVFEFKEPGKRHATRLLSSAMEIVTAHPGVFAGDDGGDEFAMLAQQCGVIESVYPFIYDVLKIDEKAQAHIDDNAGPLEVLGALTAILGVLSAPFAGSGTTTAKGTGTESPPATADTKKPLTP